MHWGDKNSMIFDEFENIGTKHHEIYDTKDWDERKMLHFINYNVNKRTAMLEKYLLFACVTLLVILFRIW